jgi:hypothetical protein
VNFDRYPYSELSGYLELFIELGWCTRCDSNLKSYEGLLLQFNIVQDRLEQIISDMVNDIPGFKRFLLIHSVFNVNDRDWLEKYMAKILQPDECDIDWFISDPFIPPDIMEKLKQFDPEAVGATPDPIRITYKMWGNFKKGEQYEPICLTDLDWELVSKETQEAAESIMNASIVECDPVLSNSDIPF